MNKLTPIKHGTPQGYKQERYRIKTGRLDITCPECRSAWAHYCTQQDMKRASR